MAKFWELRGPRLNHATLLLVVAPSFFCFGYNQAVAGGVLTLMSFVTTFPSLDTINTEGGERQYNSKIQGTVISLYTVGAVLGALSCIKLGDFLGRRRTIFFASGVAMLGAILMATSFSLAQFILARIFLGIGTGGYTAIIPVWQSEISRSQTRGAHVVLEGFFVGLGITFALWIDFAFYFLDPNSVSWRFPFGVQALLPLTAMVSIFSLPESPRWLLLKDRTQEASDVLAVLEDTSPESDSVKSGLAEIQESLAVAGRGSLKDLFRMGEKRIFHRVVIATTVQIFMQMSGISLITFYTSTIFEQDLKFDATLSRILAACMEMCQPIGGAIAFFTIDRYGRRPLMLFSAAAMMICMAVLAGANSDPNNKKGIAAATAFLFLFNLVFPIGFLGLPFLYTSEVAPLNLRAPVSAVANATNWLFNFLVTQVTPIGFSTIQNKYYIIYAIINALMIPTIYFCFPETKGRTLEDIDSIFTQAKNIFDPPKITRRLISAVHSNTNLERKEGDVAVRENYEMETLP